MTFVLRIYEIWSEKDGKTPEAGESEDGSLMEEKESEIKTKGEGEDSQSVCFSRIRWKFQTRTFPNRLNGG